MSEKQQASAMDDRRANNRKRTLKGVKATYGDFRYVVDCIIRNVSDTGAQLRSDHSSEIPDDFHVFDPNDQSLRAVEVVWRRERDIGVRFAGDPVNVHTSGDLRHARFRFL